MFRYIAIFFLIFTTSLFIANDAFAKRFGGGKSFGMQRNVSQRQHTSYANTQQHASSNPLKSSSRFGKWGAALAGLALGGLLSYLLMGHGLGASVLSWIAIAMVIMLIIQFFRSRKMQTAAAGHSAQNRSFFENVSSTQTSYNHATHASSLHAMQSSDSIPGFDENQFLRDAKAKFIRLQTAYDQKNLSDIREFTTPEVFSEIQLQFNERGDANNYTEILELNAELLEQMLEFQVPIASVRFSGRLKEHQDALALIFEETWHFRGETNNSWRVAGIQQ